MKKTIKKLLYLIFTSIVLSCTSCIGFEDEDFKYCKENIVSLVNILASNNDEELKLQFADNMKKDDFHFNSSINELCTYFEGEYVSNTDIIPTVSGGFNNGKERAYYIYSTDVKTTVTNYRFYVGWNRIDYDAKNQGIWVLYLIKYDDDVEQNKKYVGDGLMANGIHIGKVRITYYSDKILDYCKNKDKSNLYSAFSNVTKTNVATLSNDIDLCFSNYVFDYDTLYVCEVKVVDTDKECYDISYTVKKDNDFYSYFIRLTLNDKDDTNNNGMSCFYVVERNSSEDKINIEAWWPSIPLIQGIVIVK